MRLIALSGATPLCFAGTGRPPACGSRRTARSGQAPEPQAVPATRRHGAVAGVVAQFERLPAGYESLPVLAGLDLIPARLVQCQSQCRADNRRPGTGTRELVGGQVKCQPRQQRPCGGCASKSTQATVRGQAQGSGLPAWELRGQASDARGGGQVQESLKELRRTVFSRAEHRSCPPTIAKPRITSSSARLPRLPPSSTDLRQTGGTACVFLCRG